MGSFDSSLTQPFVRSHLQELLEDAKSFYELGQIENAYHKLFRSAEYIKHVLDQKPHDKNARFYYHEIWQKMMLLYPKKQQFKFPYSPIINPTQPTFSLLKNWFKSQFLEKEWEHQFKGKFGDHHAVSFKEAYIANELFLEKSPSLEDQLKWAVDHGYEQFLSSLIETHPHVLGSADKPSLLESAVKNGFSKILSILIAQEVDVQFINAQGWSLLHLAAFYNRTECAFLLKNATMNAKTPEGLTPLHLAALQGNTKLCDFLISNGARVNTLESKCQATALQLACYENHSQTALLLIQKGGNIKLKDSCGRGLLHWAASTGHLELLKYGLKSGLDLDALDDSGRTPLHWAVFSNNLEAVNLLLDTGSNPNLSDKLGYRPLTLGAFNNQADFVKLLFEKGAR